MKSARRLLLLGALILATPAQAGVWVYQQETFAYTQPTSEPPRTLEATITLADDATLADLPTLSTGQHGDFGTVGNFGPLLALSFSQPFIVPPAGPVASRTTTLADFIPYSTACPHLNCIYGWSISPGHSFFGDVSNSYDFEITIAADDSATILASSDFPGCFYHCVTTGRFVNVPEPSSLPGYAIGLLLLLAVRRMRRTTPSTASYTPA